MDYKEMYFELFRATEKAINILIEAQQNCEKNTYPTPKLPSCFQNQPIHKYKTKPPYTNGGFVLS